MVATTLPNWIPTQPPAQARTILPIFVLTEGGGGAPGFGAETVGEGGGEASRLDCNLTKGALFVVGGNGAVGTHVLGDITVGVIAG